jgi:hypothetical protein
MRKVFVIALLVVSLSAFAKNWRYDKVTDDMTGKEIWVADCESTNSIELAWLHGKSVTARLSLREHPRHGKNVMLTLTAGQLLCRSYENCSITVRFDDAPPKTWSARGPPDGDSKMIFILGYDRFLKALRKASVVRIEVPLYQEGNRAFTFNSANLDKNW